MMLASAEARWFFRGVPPASVWEWFRRGDLWAAQAPRVDHYLLLPGCETASVKLREGRLEVKVQVDGPVTVEYPAGIRGYRQRWVKWSRTVADVPGSPAFPLAGNETWVRVGKERTLRRFALGETAGPPREIDASGEPARRGCGVEVTELGIRAAARSRGRGRWPEKAAAATDSGSSTWWTLGLEGFDEAGDGTACLDRVARLLFADAPPVRLDLDSSRPYPGWLTAGR